MTGVGYSSPILDAVAERAIEALRAAGQEGMIVARLCEATGAAESTLRGVLSGSSARFGEEPFERAPDLLRRHNPVSRRRLQRWRLRVSWLEANP